MFTGTQVVDMTKKNTQQEPVTFIALFLTVPTATLRNAMIRPLGDSNVEKKRSKNHRLDWLDLTMTFNKSFCEINCDFGHDNVHEYFNCTTKPDVDLLFVHSTQSPVSPGCIPQPHRRFKPQVTSVPAPRTPCTAIPRTEIIRINKSCRNSLTMLASQKHKTVPKKKSPHTFIRMVLTRKDGRVYANRTYKLIVDGVKYHGKTDWRGFLEKAIPEDSKQGKLILQIDDVTKEAVEWNLDIV